KVKGRFEKNFPLNSKDYELYEEVGEGVSAAVYRALCVPRNEIVAIKVLDLEKCHNDLDGIRREVQTMILLDHPNVLRAHCSFSTGRHLWVVMPFMAGGSCLHIMKSAYPDGFEEPVIASLLFEVLKALAYLHDHSHIHRDVKAGNILIDHDGAVKLADFGVSASMLDTGDRKRARNTFVGTPCWMAPEVMQQLHGYDFKADIWSFGITALELAHGHAPFSKYPPMKVLLMTLQNAPPGLDYERDKRFSKAFKEMIAACLVKDPKKRPSSEKLLKHPFFKSARSRDFLAHAILDGLPHLGERFKMLKAKEAELLVQDKALYENKDHLSQKEYIRGISMWNFNLEDMKNQAELFLDDPIVNSEDSSVSGNYQDRQGDIGSPIERPRTIQGDHDHVSCQMEGVDDDIDNLEDSFAAFPITPLQALKGFFDVYEDDAGSPISNDSVQLDSDRQSPNLSLALPTDREPGLDGCGDHFQSRPVDKEFSSSLLLQENNALVSKMSTGDRDRDYLQTRLIGERNHSGPLQYRLKKDIGTHTFGRRYFGRCFCQIPGTFQSDFRR
ncbi:hypothetical protein M569_02983, partial [Genlisea aurea]